MPRWLGLQRHSPQKCLKTRLLQCASVGVIRTLTIMVVYVNTSSRPAYSGCICSFKERSQSNTSNAISRSPVLLSSFSSAAKALKQYREHMSGWWVPLQGQLAARCGMGIMGIALLLLLLCCCRSTWPDHCHVSTFCQATTPAIQVAQAVSHHRNGRCTPRHAA